MVLIGCAVYIVLYYMEQQREAELMAELQAIANATPEPTPVPTLTPTVKPTATPEPTPTPEPIEVPIDFAGLQAQNSDIYAWISIADTVIDYPLLQSTDTEDGYYLDHLTDHSYHRYGSIYTEKASGTDFEISNTVIYGHDTVDVSRFGGLRYYQDENYLREHDIIMVYTPTSILTYQVYAAVVFSDKHLMYAFDFETEEGMQKFLDETYSKQGFNNVVRDDIQVTSEDRVITLSTCTNNDNTRLLVQAVLIDEQK